MKINFRNILIAGVLVIVLVASTQFHKYFKSDTQIASAQDSEDATTEEETSEECTPEICGEGTTDDVTTDVTDQGDQETAGSSTTGDNLTPEEAAAQKAAEEAAAQKAAEEAAAQKAAEEAAAQKAAEEAAAQKAAEEAAAQKAAEEQAAAQARQAAAEAAAQKAAEERAAAQARQAAAEAAAQKAAEEAQANTVEVQQAAAEKKAAEEAVIKKAAAEVAQKSEEANIVARQQEAQMKAEDLIKTVAASPAFKEIFGGITIVPATPLIQDTNGNGIPDSMDPNPTQVDPRLIQLQADLAVKEAELKKEGKSAKEIAEIIKNEEKKGKAKIKINAIREIAQKYGVTIANSKQGTEIDGTSDEVKVLFGMDLNEKVPETAPILPLEKKLLRLNTKSKVELEKKCAISVQSGDRISTNGFTLLAACPSSAINKFFTLFGIDKNGRKTALETKKPSANGKILFSSNKKLKAGKYIMQVQEIPSSKFGLLSSYLLANAVNSNGDPVMTSDPSLVEMVEEIDVPEPVVKSIEGIDVSLVRNIKLSRTRDGKVRVSGLADISTVVIGTFSSAVFTSAILADVDSGGFEVVSPRALEAGDHEVVIYATRPEDSTQSVPVKLKFSIIPTAQAASNEAHPAAAENKFPTVPVVVGAAIVLLAIGIALIKKNKKSV